MVALIPDVWLHGRVSVHLLLSLLCDQAADRGHGLDVPVLWLHAYYGVFVLPADRVDRLLRLLLVRAEDLQCREGGLIRWPVDDSGDDPGEEEK